MIDRDSSPSQLRDKARMTEDEVFPDVIDSSIGTDAIEFQDAYTSDEVAGTISISEGTCRYRYALEYTVDDHGERYIYIRKYSAVGEKEEHIVFYVTMTVRVPVFTKKCFGKIVRPFLPTLEPKCPWWITMST